MMNSMNRQSIGKSTAEKALFKIRQHMAQDLPPIEDRDMDMQYQRPAILPTVNQTRVKWKAKKSDARPGWSMSTSHELPGENDPKIPLIEIIQKRHATTYDEDNRQVTHL